MKCFFFHNKKPSILDAKSSVVCSGSNTNTSESRFEIIDVSTSSRVNDCLKNDLNELMMLIFVVIPHKTSNSCFFPDKSSVTQTCCMSLRTM